jgi:hypothetical protein
MHKFLVHLLESSTCTCFEQYIAHPQEVKLGHLLRVKVPDAVLIKFDLLRMILLETCTCKGCNKCIKMCALSWSLSKVILRWTVRETSKFVH